MMHLEVLLASGYAVVLLAAAGLLEWLARHTATRAQRYRTAGFTYHPQHDLWICPENEPLWPYEFDRRHRVVRYRARPSVCNPCPTKSDCTDSHHGRELVRAVDPWPHSEAGRFHRGISVVLTVIAAAFLGAAAVAYHRPAELLLEMVMLAVTATVGVRWTRDFFRTPSGFPEMEVTRAGGARPAAGTAWGFDRHQPGARYQRAGEGGGRSRDEDAG